MTARQHLDLIGLLFILWGALILVTGGLLFAVFGLGGVGMGLAGAGGGDEDLLFISGMYGVMAIVTGLFVAAFGLPYLIVGFAMRRRKAWSRIAGLLLAALALMSFPFGTILGVYAIVKLIDDDVRALLDTGDRDALA